MSSLTKDSSGGIGACAIVRGFIGYRIFPFFNGTEEEEESNEFICS